MNKEKVKSFIESSLYDDHAAFYAELDAFSPETLLALEDNLLYLLAATLNYFHEFDRAARIFKTDYELYRNQQAKNAYNNLVLNHNVTSVLGVLLD